VVGISLWQQDQACNGDPHSSSDAASAVTVFSLLPLAAPAAPDIAGCPLFPVTMCGTPRGHPAVDSNSNLYIATIALPLGSTQISA